MKLFELTSSYKQVLDLIDEGSEFESLADTLESIEDAIEEKAENIAKLVKTIDAEAEVLKVEEKRLADRRRALENRSKGLKEYLQSNLEASGLKKVKGSLFTINIQKNPASVNILDETKIPKSYFIPQPDKLDRKSLVQAFKNGELIEGAELTQGESLRIR